MVPEPAGGSAVDGDQHIEQLGPQCLAGLPRHHQDHGLGLDQIAVSIDVLAIGIPALQRCIQPVGLGF